MEILIFEIVMFMKRTLTKKGEKEIAKIEDYVSGKAAKGVRTAFDLMQSIKTMADEPELKVIFQKNVDILEPLKLNMQKAEQQIRTAERCAVGERLCRCQFPDSPVTNAVFLDELADAMVKKGIACFVSKDEAVKALGENKGNPIVTSRVSGEYREICRTYTDNCFYWNMEKRGMKCLKNPLG